MTDPRRLHARRHHRLARVALLLTLPLAASAAHATTFNTRLLAHGDAKATLRFVGAGGYVITAFDFFDADVPLNNNARSFVSLAQGLPTGTRAMQVLLDVRRSGGASSDGYFDNVWLSVSAVPGTWGPMALGLAAIVARARPGRR